jgi:hypothetical protein
MSEKDEYVPLIDREREPKDRVHEDLTKTARERLAKITEDISGSEYQSSETQLEAFDRLKEKVGVSTVNNKIHAGDDDEMPMKYAHIQYVTKGKTRHVLYYLEQLLLIHYRRYHSYSEATSSELEEKYGNPVEKETTFEKINDVLVTEGILWKMEWTGKGGVIEFNQIESGALKDIDEKVQGLSDEGPWNDSTQRYNAAFDRYLNGDFDDTLVKKLYNSIEELLQTICVDLEGWTEDRDMSHQNYLQLLNEKGVYNANGITAPELGQLLDSLEKMVSKVANDRKQRHAYHDRAYCTLLIHQVGAYLYFIINRYEEFDSS